MGQRLQNDSIVGLTFSAGVVTVGSGSVLTIGGQQYILNANVNLTLPSLTANAQYYLYAVVSSGVVSLVQSTNNNSVGPAGFNGWLLIAPFYSSSTGGFGAFSSNNQKDSSPVGAVASSMLTEPQFQALNGTSWILADGRSVTGSQYAAITGLSTVPDLRGQMLRGKNNGRADGNQDPAGERALGNFQSDAFQGHNHLIPIGTNAGGGGNGGIISANNFIETTSGPTNDGVNGTPRTTTETRVKNIAVNHFIKINP